MVFAAGLLTDAMGATIASATSATESSSGHASATVTAHLGEVVAAAHAESRCHSTWTGAESNSWQQHQLGRTDA